MGRSRRRSLARTLSGVHAWLTSDRTTLPARRRRHWTDRLGWSAPPFRRKALLEAGATVDLLSVKDGEIEAKEGDLNPAGSFTVDRLVADANVSEYDGRLLPGGTVNPDKLRVDEAALGFVRDFVGSGKPVASICHGPWTLLEAGVVSGRTVTSFPSIRTDLRNAGAEWVDQEVVVDQRLVTSRKPDDLEAFNAKIVEEFEEGKHAAQRG